MAARSLLMNFSLSLSQITIGSKLSEYSTAKNGNILSCVVASNGSVSVSNIAMFRNLSAPSIARCFRFRSNAVFALPDLERAQGLNETGKSPKSICIGNDVSISKRHLRLLRHFHIPLSRYTLANSDMDYLSIVHRVA